LQDDAAYSVNASSDDDIDDALLLQDSCARTVVYAPKRARYFSVIRVKGVEGNSSQSYEASPTIWDHTVLPATSQRLIHCRRAGWYSIYLPVRYGRLSWPWSLGGWLYSEIVYLCKDSHSSKCYWVWRRSAALIERNVVDWDW